MVIFGRRVKGIGLQRQLAVEITSWGCMCPEHWRGAFPCFLDYLLDGKCVLILCLWGIRELFKENSNTYAHWQQFLFSWSRPFSRKVLALESYTVPQMLWAMLDSPIRIHF